MESIKQLLRHPLKTIAGILLMTAAAAVLCICLGQSLAANRMEENLDELFTSVALVTSKEQFSSRLDLYGVPQYEVNYQLPPEVAAWMERTARDYPHIVEGIHQAGLASAYLPELVADSPRNHYVDMTTEQVYYKAVSGYENGDPQRGAILRIRVDRMDEQLLYGEEDVYQTVTGTVEEVLGIQQSTPDPTGFTARMEFRAPTVEALERFGLETGKSYLVAVEDYEDLDWALRCAIALGNLEQGEVEAGFRADESTILIPEFLPEKLTWLVEEDGWEERGYFPNFNLAFYQQDEVLEDGTVKKRSVTLNVAAMKQYRSVRFSIRDPEDIVPVEGETAAYLAENRAWQVRLDTLAVHTHAFPVVGVENLMAVGDFALERASITQGRNFTPEEIASGAKVCILSEQVAALSGLTVGDTIAPRFYSRDGTQTESVGVEDGVGIIDPVAWPYGPGSGMEPEESYTIVGLYGKDVPWQGPNSMYEFTLNTIFTPKKALNVPLEEGELGIFRSVVLVNGGAADFLAIAEREALEGQFEVADQGYTTVKESLHNYKEVARQAVAVGCAVFLAITVLFLILFPGQEKKNLSIMDSVGANRGEKLRHMMVTILGILGPGAAAGLGAGALLWDRVVAELTAFAGPGLELKLDLGTMGLIALGQLAVGALLGLGVSLPMTRSRGLRRRGLGRKLRQTRLKGSTVCIFALVVSLVLCALNKANEAERASFEESYRNTPVKVTLVSLSDHDAYNLRADGFVRDIFTDERFAAFTPQKYLKDTQLISSIWTAAMNENNSQEKLQPMDPVLLEAGVEIQWNQPFTETVLESAAAVLFVPEGMELADMDKHTPGTQVQVSMQYNPVTNWRKEPYRQMMTVAGTHNIQQGIYCAAPWYDAVAQELGVRYSSGGMWANLYSVDSFGEYVIGITSQAVPLNLSAQRKCQITWLEGHGPEELDGIEPVALVPESRALPDMQPEVPGKQILLNFSNPMPDGYDDQGNPVYRTAENPCYATVIGTYVNSIDSQDIYCSFDALRKGAAAVGLSLSLDHISATVKDNQDIPALREMADQWFADPEKESDVTKQFQYALDIDKSTLNNLEKTLQNSIKINNVCTVLVFVLTAGAGFFLGFLMVRGRKREIILMRTLGKPNGLVYLDFAREQMLWAALGMVLGGALFRWQPAGRLALFLGIYFAGLSGALVLFLRSTLLTTMKEAE